MTLPGGPPVVSQIEWAIFHGDGQLEGLIHRTQDIVSEALKAEVQLSTAWNWATQVVWEGLQRGIPLVLAIIQGIVQRLFNTVEQFPGVHQALDFIEQVPGVSQLQGLMSIAADQFDGTAKAISAVIDQADGTAIATFNQYVTTPIEAIVDFADGTASGLAQLFVRGDGTAIFSSPNGPVPRTNTLLGIFDNLDGTAMSLARVIQNVGIAAYEGRQTVTRAVGLAQQMLEGGLGALGAGIPGIEEQVAAWAAALKAFPGANLTGDITAALTMSGTAITTLLQYLNALGQFDAGQLSNLGNFAWTGVTDLLHNLSGLLPTAIGNGDGTATPTTTGLAQLVANADGTVTYLASQASTGANTLLDNLDGTAMSLGSAFQTAGNFLGAHQYALSSWQQVLADTGVQNAGQFASSLQGVIPAALDNLDGTAANLGSQIVHNLDGTANYIGSLATDATNTLIDNLDGTAMSFAKSVASGWDAMRNSLFSAFTGQQVSAAVTPQVQQAQITDAAAALQQRVATIGNGGEEQVDVEFSAYSNGALPTPAWISSWTTSPSANISGGLLVYSATNDSLEIYESATCLTDYHQASGVFTSISSGQPFLAVRLNGSGSAGALAYYTPTGWTFWDLSGTNGVGGNLALFGDTFTPGAEYRLVAGDPESELPRRYRILKNGVPLTIASALGYPSQVGQTYLDDTSGHISYGGAYRACGLGNIQGPASFSMSSFKFQDNAQSSPSVLLTISESTGSTTYTDLATVSDEVAVKIGSSGMAWVTIGANFGQTTAGDGALMSFAMSGANTQSASDTSSVGIKSFASGQSDTMGFTFPLSGLAPGLTVFKAKYRAVGGGTASYTNRSLGVLAL